MATVTTRPAASDREESRRKVGHPLQRLRGYIRCYVLAEGLAVLLIYLALWFWIGLLLDYGLSRCSRSTGCRSCRTASGWCCFAS